MRINFLFAMAVATALVTSGIPGAGSGGTAQAQNMAHAHMGHVTSSWKDTPGKVGLIQALEAEATIAAQHAGFAAAKPGDLAWMQTHTRHVRHAINSATEASGPGQGYGVLKAAKGVAAHIGFAAASEGASANVKLHATHVSTSANNVVTWSGEIIALSEAVLAAKTPAEAAGDVKKIQALTGHILHGFDADGNGTTGWQKGEGGLAQASQHMGFMGKGEGM